MATGAGGAGELPIAQILIDDLGCGYYRLNLPNPSASGLYRLSDADAHAFPWIGRALLALRLERVLSPTANGTLWQAYTREFNLKVVSFQRIEYKEER